MATTRCTAFAGSRMIASGELRDVAMKAKQARDADAGVPVRIFEDRSGRPIELPLDGSDAELLRVLAGARPAAQTHPCLLYTSPSPRD